MPRRWGGYEAFAADDIPTVTLTVDYTTDPVSLSGVDALDEHAGEDVLVRLVVVGSPATLVGGGFFGSPNAIYAAVVSGSALYVPASVPWAAVTLYMSDGTTVRASPRRGSVVVGHWGDLGGPFEVHAAGGSVSSGLRVFSPSSAGRLASARLGAVTRYAVSGEVSFARAELPLFVSSSTLELFDASGSLLGTVELDDYTWTDWPTAAERVETVTLDASVLALGVGASRTLTATVEPDEATAAPVTWSSSDTDVATVDSSGNVKAVGEGQATITATAGGKSATCVVTVQAASGAPAVPGDDGNPTVSAGDGDPTVNPVEDTFLEATVSITGVAQRIRVYDPNGVLPDDCTLKAEVVKTHESLDDGTEIEHIMSYDITLVDSNGTPLDMPRSGLFYLCFEVLPGLDTNELQVVLVEKYADGQFDEEIVSIDGAQWVRVGTNHCSPWSLIDPLTDDDKAANNVKTGDKVVQTAIAELVSVMVMALGVMLPLLKKKKFEI